MNLEQAKYDLQTLPLRQLTLRAMAREDTQKVDGLRAIREEFKSNAARLEKARALLAEAGDDR